MKYIATFLGMVILATGFALAQAPAPKPTLPSYTLDDATVKLFAPLVERRTKIQAEAVQLNADWRTQCGVVMANMKPTPLDPGIYTCDPTGTKVVPQRPQFVPPQR